MRISHSVGTAAVGLAVFGVACAPHDEAQSHEHAESPAQAGNISHAVVVLSPTEGSDTHGTVTFTQGDAGILIVADILGLEPGEHGFHVHEFGDCSASDGTSAGGHFNPGGLDHGAPSDSHRHVGDLGNLTADEAGAVHYEFTDTQIAFTGPNSIIGRGVIVHAGADDLTTQPTGAAGGRVACGVVGISRP